MSMFGTKHSTSVWPAPRNRGYQYRCSCGATGYTTTSSHKAGQMGRDHEAKAGKKGRG